MISATIGTTSLNTLRPSWTNSLSRAPIPLGSARFRKPKLLRMLLENLVFRRVSTIRNGARARGCRLALHDHRGAGVAEDEVAVAVAEVQVARADLRADHQHRARRARCAPRCAAMLMPKVAEEQATFMSKAKPSMPSASCTSTADGRVGALQVRAGDDHRVDVGGRAAGLRQRLARRVHGHLALQRGLVVGALGDVRAHARGIEHAALVDHEAAPDARGLLDEASLDSCIGATLAGGDGRGVLGVPVSGVGVERRHQLAVGDRLGRGEETRSADHDLLHVCEPRKNGALPELRGLYGAGPVAASRHSMWVGICRQCRGRQSHVGRHSCRQVPAGRRRVRQCRTLVGMNADLHRPPEGRVHLNCRISWLIDSLASPNSMRVFSLKNSGLSMPAKPEAMERFSTNTCAPCRR